MCDKGKRGVEIEILSMVEKSPKFAKKRLNSLFFKVFHLENTSGKRCGKFKNRQTVSFAASNDATNYFPHISSIGFPMLFHPKIKFSNFKIPCGVRENWFSTFSTAPTTATTTNILFYYSFSLCAPR